MATTAAQLVTRAKTNLIGTRRELRDVANGALTTTATTITVTHNASYVKPGHYIEVDDEVMYVMSKAASVLTVLRGELGSTAATHDNGALVTYAPEHPRFLIFDAMTQEVQAWPETVYLIDEDTVAQSTSSPRAVLGADPETFIKVLRAWLVPTTSEEFYSRMWFSVINEFYDNEKVGIELQADAALGVASSVKVQYAIKIEPPAATTTDLETLMPPTLFDALVYGAMARRLVSLEAQRADIHTTPESRRPDEYPPGYGAQVSASYRAIADFDLGREERRLRRTFGPLERR